MLASHLLLLVYMLGNIEDDRQAWLRGIVLTVWCKSISKKKKKCNFWSVMLYFSLLKAVVDPKFGSNAILIVLTVLEYPGYMFAHVNTMFQNNPDSNVNVI